MLELVPSKAVPSQVSQTTNCIFKPFDPKAHSDGKLHFLTAKAKERHSFG